MRKIIEGNSIGSCVRILGDKLGVVSSFTTERCKNDFYTIVERGKIVSFFSFILLCRQFESETHDGGVEIKPEWTRIEESPGKKSRALMSVIPRRTLLSISFFSQTPQKVLLIFKCLIYILVLFNLLSKS